MQSHPIIKLTTLLLISCLLIDANLARGLGTNHSRPSASFNDQAMMLPSVGTLKLVSGHAFLAIVLASVGCAVNPKPRISPPRPVRAVFEDPHFSTLEHEVNEAAVWLATEFMPHFVEVRQDERLRLKLEKTLSVLGYLKHKIPDAPEIQSVKDFYTAPENRFKIYDTLLFTTVEPDGLVQFNSVVEGVTYSDPLRALSALLLDFARTVHNHQNFDRLRRREYFPDALVRDRAALRLEIHTLELAVRTLRENDARFHSLQPTVQKRVKSWLKAPLTKVGQLREQSPLVRLLQAERIRLSQVPRKTRKLRTSGAALLGALLVVFPLIPNILLNSASPNSWNWFDGATTLLIASVMTFLPPALLFGGRVLYRSLVSMSWRHLMIATILALNVTTWLFFASAFAQMAQIWNPSWLVSWALVLICAAAILACVELSGLLAGTLDAKLLERWGEQNIAVKAREVLESLKAITRGDEALQGGFQNVWEMKRAKNYGEVLLFGRNRKEGVIYYLPWMVIWPGILTYLIIRRALAFAHDDWIAFLSKHDGLSVPWVTSVGLWYIRSNIHLLPRTHLYLTRPPSKASAALRNNIRALNALERLFWFTYLCADSLVVATLAPLLILVGFLLAPIRTSQSIWFFTDLSLVPRILESA